MDEKIPEQKDKIEGSKTQSVWKIFLRNFFNYSEPPNGTFPDGTHKPYLKPEFDFPKPSIIIAREPLFWRVFLPEMEKRNLHLGSTGFVLFTIILTSVAFMIAEYAFSQLNRVYLLIYIFIYIFLPLVIFHLYNFGIYTSIQRAQKNMVLRDLSTTNLNPHTILACYILPYRFGQTLYLLSLVFLYKIFMLHPDGAAGLSTIYLWAFPFCMFINLFRKNSTVFSACVLDTSKNSALRYTAYIFWNFASSIVAISYILTFLTIGYRLDRDQSILLAVSLFGIFLIAMVFIIIFNQSFRLIKLRQKYLSFEEMFKDMVLN